MSEAVLWVHDEMLRPECVPSGVAAVFVFDKAWIEDQRLSLKRIVFLYECLQAMPGVEIRKGDVVAEVSAFAQRHDATGIQTYRSPLPRIKRQGEALGAEWIDPEPIATLPEGVDLKRFSRYWRKVEKQVMRRED
ncbi:MAG: hypothetical protein AAF589_05930 [Planctomycetota bacterium]